jgi:predicted ATPase
VGKTRLAIETARTAVRKFKDGVFWVSLAALTDANLIPQEIAQALHVRETPSEPVMTTLGRHVHGKEMLMVLDNCEHLIRACAQITEALLGASPGLRVLATSLEGLGLFNESIFQVPSLPLPDVQHATPVNVLHDMPACGCSKNAANANPGFAHRRARCQVCICSGSTGYHCHRAGRPHESVANDRQAADDRSSLLTASRTAIQPSEVASHHRLEP